jgi:hypothetical protein
VPPALVYGDGYGGIDEVRWAINIWGGAKATETTDGCYSGSCLLVEPLGQWEGLHLYYRQAFPTSTFSSLSLRLKAASGGGNIVVAPSHEGARCNETTALVGAEWTQINVNVSAACTGLSQLNGVTLDNPGNPMALMIDDVRFGK